MDLRRTLVLEVGRGARGGDSADESPHIQAHSTALHSWLGRRFGDDSFFAGGDFGVVSSDVRPLRHVMLAGMLEASLLSPRALLQMLRSPEDRAFLLRRRDEVWATLVGRRFRASESRL